MPLSTNKLIAVALTGTGVAGAGAGTYYSSSSNSQISTNMPVIKSEISKLIKVSNRTILGKDLDSSWDIKVAVYDELIKSLNLSENVKEGVKEWCKQTLNEVVDVSKIDEKNSDYEKAIKLCTKPTNKEKLLKNNKKLAGEEHWKGKETAYRADSNNDNKNIPTIKDKTKATAKEISDWCLKTLKEEILDSESTYNIAEKWCTTT